MKRYKKGLPLLLASVMLMSGLSVFASEGEIPLAPYVWNNLPIGAGGFVTGVVFHPLEEGLIYCRTDVGGAYRWDKDNESWIPLNDGFLRSESNLFGIDGIALDPQDPDVVYIAAGKYWWEKGDVFKSVDRGNTWKRTGLNKNFHGNGTVRAYGECIAVDPANSNIVLVGTNRDGLWASEDGAMSWKKVPGIDTAPEQRIIRSIVFDKNSSERGETKIIYVGVTNKGVYKSSDGGRTWNFLDGSPAVPRRLAVSSDGSLLVASTTGLYKYSENSVVTWEEISPEQGQHFASVAIDPNDSNIIITSGPPKNIMRIPIHRSVDGGKTWSNTIDNADVASTLPWLEDDNFSSNTCLTAIDPFNPNHVYFSDWFGIWRTEDITATPVSWTNPVQGIEEMVPFDAISPPEGKHRLYTALADNDGMFYEDITKTPLRKFTDKYKTYGEPRLMGCTSIDFCEQDVNIIVRIGRTHNNSGDGGYSTDGGISWNKFETYPADDSGTRLINGKMAVSAQKNPNTGIPNIVAIPLNHPAIVSSDFGKTWTKVSGLPDNILTAYWSRIFPIASDRVNGNKFYVMQGQQVYVSVDGGYTWTPAAQFEGSGVMQLKTMPNVEGEVWINANEKGLLRSSDSAATFTRVEGVDSVVSFGFGKEAPGNDKTEPTIYLYGTVGGLEGVYRSTDLAKSWERIDNLAPVATNIPNFVVGCRQQFGVVYIGTDGRGIFYGAPEATDVTALNVKTDTVKDIETVVPDASDKINIALNGAKLALEDAQTIEGAVYVPARTFLESLGAKVEWLADEMAAKVSRKEYNGDLRMFITPTSREIVFYSDSSTVKLNRVDKDIGKAPFIADSKLYIPLKETAELFDALYKYDGTTNIIIDNALVLD